MYNVSVTIITKVESNIERHFINRTYGFMKHYRIAECVVISVLLRIEVNFLVHLQEASSALLLSLAVRRSSSVRPSSLTFQIFDFFSATQPQNKIQRTLKGSNVPMPFTKFVGFFLADQESKMAAPASVLLIHF